MSNIKDDKSSSDINRCDDKREIPRANPSLGMLQDEKRRVCAVFPLRNVIMCGEIREPQAQPSRAHYPAKVPRQLREFA